MRTGRRWWRGSRLCGTCTGRRRISPPPACAIVAARGRAFEARAAALARPYAEDPEAPQRILSQRILKHLHELFVFVEDLAVPGDNNLAERSLRTVVIARKISGGTRSPEGSTRRMGLMSLFKTWSAEGRPALKTCRELLLPTPVP